MKAHTLKLIIILLMLIFSNLIQAQISPPFESDPHRGMYVNGFIKNSNGKVNQDWSILGVDKDRNGIYEKEDKLLQYAQNNHITYLLLFDIDKLFANQNITAFDKIKGAYTPLEEHLCRFISKARNQYCITQIGVVIGGSGSADDVIDWNDLFQSPTAPFLFSDDEKAQPTFPQDLLFVETPYLPLDPRYLEAEFTKFMLRISHYTGCHDCSEHIDFINLEGEFWNEPIFADLCSAYQTWITVLYHMKDVAIQWNLNPNNTHDIFTEVYLQSFPDEQITNLGCNGYTNGWLMGGNIDGCSPSWGFPTVNNPTGRLADRISAVNYWGDWPRIPNANNGSYCPGGFRFLLGNLSATWPPTCPLTDVQHLFSAEKRVTGGGWADYAGTWLEQSAENNIFSVERIAYEDWRNWDGACGGVPSGIPGANVRSTYGVTTDQNDVQPGGTLWYTYKAMEQYDRPAIFTSNSPVCADPGTSIGTLTFEYIGPMEPGIEYIFWITDAGNNTVYTVGPNNSTDYIPQLTAAPTQNRLQNIDFSNPGIFPICTLSVGTYTAHLLLKYQGIAGCDYQQDLPIDVSTGPTIVAQGDINFCEGGNVTLQAPVGDPTTTYDWQRNGQSIQTGANNKLIVYNSGNYSCNINTAVPINFTCNGNSNSINVNVFPNPQIMISVECNSGNYHLYTNPIVLTSPGSHNPNWAGLTYLWETGETTADICGVWCTDNVGCCYKS